MTSDATGTADDEAVAPTTVYELNQQARVEIRRLPRLVVTALRLVWRAAGAEAVTALGLQGLSGPIVLLQLLFAAKGLRELLAQAHPDGSFTAVLPWLVLMGVISAVSIAGTTVQQDRQQVLGELVRRRMETDTLEVAESVDLGAFEIPAFHNRLQRVGMASHEAVNLVTGTGRLIGAAAALAGVVVALAVIQPLLVPMLALALLPAWLGGSRRSEALMRFTWQLTPQDRERMYIQSLLTSRDTAKEVRALTLTGYLRGRFSRLYAERIGRLRELARGQLLVSLVTALAVAGVTLAVLLVLTWLAVNGRVSVAQTGVAVGAMAIAGGNLARIGWSAEQLAQASAFVEDYLAFQQLRAGAVAGPAADVTGPLERIEARGLTFAYPAAPTPVLQDVSLHLDAGEVVALVGENGSGKTTLAKLLATLYRPTGGQVRWNGQDTAQLAPQLLHSRTAVIFQDFIRFHLPLWENVALGRHERAEDRDAVRAALRQAGLDATVAALPEQDETMLGPEFQGGTDLSLGQWQKLAVARAFFRDAPFVILDEPTAALDPKAEHELFQRIRELLAGRTVLLISHRFSSARAADRILVLEAGRLVESGTHPQLMATGGRYAELFSLQARAYADDEPSTSA